VLEGSTVVLGVTGGIAAYKAAEIVRWLKKEGAAVVVVMSPAAKRFVTPLTLSTLSGNPVLDDLWAPNQTLTFGRPRARTSAVEHIEVADAADLVIVAPATADLLAKAALGLGDDMVTTVLLATQAPVLYAPAMNVQMWDHPAVQENVATLRARGAFFADPEEGELACGWEGRGRLASLEAIERAVARIVGGERKDARSAAARDGGAGVLAGRRVVVTAGPTREPLDPVRYLSNHSSGKMGYALAEAARDAGAAVTLVSGPTALVPPSGVAFVAIETARELERALAKAADGADAVIMAAAVADFRPAAVARQKLKRADGARAIELAANPDILASLPRRNGLRVVGFAVETEKELAGARAKLRAKRCDLLVLNNPTKDGSRFGGDTNQVTILDGRGKAEALPVMTKRAAAERIVARVAALFEGELSPGTVSRAIRSRAPSAKAKAKATRRGR
jgi:phosphopantothenoylcysteine decarboxylase/phosphopantothenate--cysteine ligase